MEHRSGADARFRQARAAFNAITAWPAAKKPTPVSEDLADSEDDWEPPPPPAEKPLQSDPPERAEPEPVPLCLSDVLGLVAKCVDPQLLRRTVLRAGLQWPWSSGRGDLV